MMTPLQIAALRQGLTAKLRAEAKKRSVPVEQVRKRYIFTVFFAHLFHAPDVPWVVIGGNALLLRTGGGRFTQAIDLAREQAWASHEAIRHELQMLLLRGQGKTPFRFILLRFEDRTSVHLGCYSAIAAKIHVDAVLGERVFERFSIDVSKLRHPYLPADPIRPQAIITHDTLRDLPLVPTVPVEAHLADKICGLYERHGDTGASPSTRYRDLADIVRVIATETIDAERLRTVLDREATRRHLKLPTSLEPPHPSWEERFPVEAEKYAEYPKELRTLASSLGAAQLCLNEVLWATNTGHLEPCERSVAPLRGFNLSGHIAAEDRYAS